MFTISIYYVIDKVDGGVDRGPFSSMDSSIDPHHGSGLITGITELKSK